VWLDYTAQEAFVALEGREVDGMAIPIASNGDFTVELPDFNASFEGSLSLSAGDLVAHFDSATVGSNSVSNITLTLTQ